MKDKLIKLALSPLIVLAIFLALACPVYALPSIDGAFSPDFEDSVANYADKYSWDKDLYWEREWTVTYDAEEHTIKRKAGYQYEYLKDNIETTSLYLNDVGSSILSRGGGGGNIVAVALAEVGKPDSLEVPPSSNDVKYNTWYYGQRVSGSDYPWCCAFVSWCADQCGYIESGLFARTASCAMMYQHLTQDQGFESYGTRSTTTFGGGSYTPVPGDILFFYSAGSSLPYSHIGIICEVNEESIRVVEGNTTGGGTVPGGGVAINTYARGGSSAAHDGFIVSVDYPAGSYGLGAVTDQEVEWLAALIFYESRGFNSYCLELTAQVAVNRVNSPLFPDTLEAVFKQEGQYGYGWGPSYTGERIFLNDGLYWRSEDEARQFPYLVEQCYDAALKVAEGLSVDEDGNPWPSNVVFQHSFTDSPEKLGMGPYFKTYRKGTYTAHFNYAK